MKIIAMLSDMIVPMMFATIILFGFTHKVKVYDAFIEGAKDGMNTVAGILPTLVGLMISVGMLRASGALDLLTDLISPLASTIGFPEEAFPLTIMRLVSSSAATGLLLDIFKNFGPDSFIGRFVSVMMSCTETVLYTMSVYFMSINITKTRYTLPGALIANVSGIIASLFITKWVFGY